MVNFNQLKSLGSELIGKAGELAEQAKEKAGPAAEKAREAAAKGVDKAAGGIDSATKGKYSDKIDSVHSKLGDTLNTTPASTDTVKTTDNLITPPVDPGIVPAPGTTIAPEDVPAGQTTVLQDIPSTDPDAATTV